MPAPARFEPVPRLRLLRTFECTARHGSFSAAAAELGTTQSAVSRAMTELERRLAARLFERVHRGVRLTRAGALYHEAVVAGLARIGSAGAALAGMEAQHVVIACDHAVSTLFLLPLRKALYRAVGGGATHVHILTCDADLLARVGEREADLVLSCDPGGGAPRDRVVAFRQAVTPVCAPAYLSEHAGVLGRPVEAWGALTLLDGARPGRGWATWDDWFETAGRPRGEPRRLRYFDYVFLLEDTVAGAGLALGWRRLIDRYLESGALVAVADGFVEVDRPHWARLTERGRRRRHARCCLQLFDDLSRRADGA